MTYLEEVQRKRLEASAKLAHEQELRESLNITRKSGEAIVGTLRQESDKSRSSVQTVKVDNADLAKSEDLERLAECVKVLGQVLKPDPIDWQPVQNALDKLASNIDSLPKQYPEVPEPLEQVTVKNLATLEPTLNKITSAINKLKLNPVFDPKITVTPANVKVVEKNIDVSPVVEAVNTLKPILQSLKEVTSKQDDSKLLSAINSTTKAINSLSFPVPNYVLPFSKDGKATQVTLDNFGSLPVTSSSSTYKLLLDDTSTTNVTYVGKAAIGSATSSSVWQIQKIDETTGMSITWANDGLFTAKWTEILTETYT